MTTYPPAASPVRLRGRLDEPLGRWLWLVKWLLAVPHLVVLAFLWLAAAVLTLAAGIAILFTGRYPRSLFDFNLGVLRWTWRVAFYAYGVLGTDVYPPFSLGPEPGYPAQLDIDYPEQLSRGLVLVKWWLLAIPHYLVLAFLTGGFGAGHVATGGGLIAVLVLIAAVTVAVTRSYPRPLFDLVIGLQRWCYRVLAYVALMRGEYPPFRLDQGGADPADPGPERAAAPPAGPAASPL